MYTDRLPSTRRRCVLGTHRRVQGKMSVGRLVRGANDAPGEERRSGGRRRADNRGGTVGWTVWARVPEPRGRRRRRC
jgi:hypothetical protein